jgi:hypothetical protein
MENNDFAVDNIPEYLKLSINELINMEINLDRFQISKSLTNSLNRELLGDKKEISQIYDWIISDFDKKSEYIKDVETKINDFNSSSDNNFKYYIDPEKITLIVLYKQILYIDDIIKNIQKYIKFDYNLVFVYAYLISKLYDIPEISSNYIFIINKKLSNPSVITDYPNKSEFTVLLEKKNLDKIFLIINLVNECDIKYTEFLNKINQQIIKKYKEEYSTIDESDSVKQKYKLTGGSDNLSQTGINFFREKQALILLKRDIDISKLLLPENFMKLFDPNNISIELWFAYNLFLYKRFNFDLNKYVNEINKLIESNKIDTAYKLNLNFMNDIDYPEVGFVTIDINKNLTGGKLFSSTQQNYKIKYLKYKNKYLNLKKTLSK